MSDSANSGLLGENWTFCVGGPGRVKFWRVCNVGPTAVTVYAAVRNLDGSFTPCGQADLAAAQAGAPAGGFTDLVDGGAELPLLAGEQLVAKCSLANGASFRIGAE